ncbi:hypothetical protein DWU99_13620 [Dyella psychrodurans]|uniref:Uncharacterized protein n=2 Tax=Dyella psychrodurans TaxID=1927960 RepID=A0A370X2L1_9GAMM|nr:hypothetical protein DWU99_13620 [Dyella psychrodurans]
METRNEVDIATAGLPHPATVAPRPKAVVCMTNHERPDCARINQEIIKLNYPEPWRIVHACSDTTYEPHMEDVLVRCQPRTIIYGALNLLQQSCRTAVEVYNPQYLVHVEADTWVFDQGIIQRYIDLLDRNPQAYLAASTWSTDQRPQWRRLHHPFAKVKLGLAKVAETVGNDFYVKRKQTLSTQFFIARNDPRFFTMIDSIQPTIENTLEYDFYQAFVREFGARAFIGIKEREPVHPLNRHWCPALTLHAQHWPEQLRRPTDVPADGTPREGVTGQYDIPGKKEVLAAYGFRNPGPAMRKLLESTDTSYYNPKAKRY